MEASDAGELTPETPVWIWILRQGHGQWCPGTVQWLAARDETANVTVRFEATPSRATARTRRALWESVPHKPDIWSGANQSAGERIDPFPLRCLAGCGKRIFNPKVIELQ